MNLREWRRAAGVTQEQLAEEAYVSRALISQVETGRTNASAMFAGRIVKALGRLLKCEVDTWDVFPGQFRKPPVIKGSSRRSTRQRGNNPAL